MKNQRIFRNTLISVGMLSALVRLPAASTNDGSLDFGDTPSAVVIPSKAPSVL